MGISTDIDIDFADRDVALLGLPHVKAIIVKKDKVLKHNTGVYFQDIPVDPQTDMAVFDYEKAAELGYFKIDFLNSTIYKNVKNEAHLIKLINTEPMWELFDDSVVVKGLAHIRNHFSIVESIKPRSIEDLAVILALIRPGKMHLVGKSRKYIDQNIWTKDQKGFEFKRAHALCYAMAIVVQLNLMVEEANQNETIG